MNRLLQPAAVALVTLFLSACSSMAMYQSISTSQVMKAGMSENVLALPDGGRLHYWDRGEGEPLILIHGLGGDAMMNWKDQMRSFDSRYRVIAPDLLWFGESGSSKAPMNLRSQAEAMFTLMDHLGIKQAHVVGHSYGGFVAYKMLDHDAQRISSLTLVSNPGPILQDKELQELIDRFQAESLPNLFIPETPAGLKTLNQGIFQKPVPAPYFLYRDIYDTFIGPNKLAQRRLVESLPEERDSFNQEQKYPDILFFLVWGMNDKIFPLHTGIHLSRYLNAPIAVLADGAHAIPAENPQELRKLLEAFLNNKRISR